MRSHVDIDHQRPVTTRRPEINVRVRYPKYRDPEIENLPRHLFQVVGFDLPSDCSLRPEEFTPIRDIAVARRSIEFFFENVLSFFP
jgi:hypothetical protein